MGSDQDDVLAQNSAPTADDPDLPAAVTPASGDPPSNSDSPAVAGSRDDTKGGSIRFPEFGRFAVLGTLGQGGMGTVFEAFDRTLDRRVAVKVISRSLTARRKRRFIREAQALAQLSHPNVVQVYEVGEVEGQTFIAMEFLRGQTLDQWARQQPRPGWKECVEIYLQAGEGLAAAHRQGLVHRDFKPNNAILGDDGRVRVLDFGLARRVDPSGASEEPLGDTRESVDATLDVRLTRDGAVLGTPAYMPPEQMRGLEVDARGDQFSFCLALYETLYAERPAAVESATGPTTDPLPLPLSAPRVPARLREILNRGLSFEPQSRWPSMDALLVALRRQVAPMRWPKLGLGLGLGLAVGAAVLGVGLVRYAEVGQRCEGGTALLEGVWDEARQQEIGQVVQATGLSFAADTWDRVSARLDTYAQGWQAKHTEVCEATRVRQAQTESVMALRMACLSSRRIDLQSAAAVLAVADETRVRRAVSLVDALPPLSLCDDVEALQSEQPPPGDPQTAERVKELREQLTMGWAMRGAGDCSGAVAIIDEVVERADALEYGPLRAEAWLSKGETTNCMGQYAQAEQELERAYLLGIEHDHERVKLRAATELVEVVGVRLARLDDVDRWIDDALARARRRQTSDAQRVALWENIGGIRDAQGKLDEALAHYRRALAVTERTLGPRHSEVAISLGNIGAALDQQGEYAEARANYERALGIFEEAYGPRHPNVAGMLSNLGLLIGSQGEYAEAQKLHLRAVGIFEEAFGPEHPAVAAALTNLGIVLDDLGELEDALARLQRALTIKERALGPEHPALASTLHTLGIVTNRLGRRSEARTHTERSLAVLEAAVGPEHPATVEPLVTLADFALEEGEWALARQRAERAVSVCEAGEVSPLERGVSRFVLARALWFDPGERGRAHALAQQVRGDFSAAGDEERIAELDAWLEKHGPT